MVLFNLKHVRKLGKIIYFLTPKIIKEQYSDLINYLYAHYERKKFYDVALIANPTCFEKTEMLQREKDRSSSVNAPQLYYCPPKFEPRTLKPVSGNVPDLYILKLCKVSAIGGTLGVLQNNKFFHPELAKQNFLHDNKCHGIITYEAAYNGIHSLKLQIKTNSHRFKNGIHLLKEHALNYYHWLYECMPRLIYIIEYIKKHNLMFKDFKLFVDKDISPQSQEMLGRYLSQYNLQDQVHFVTRGQFVFCENLYYVTPFWHAFDNTLYRPDIVRDFFVDQQAISLVKKSITFKKHNQKLPERKLYLARKNNGMRKMLNADEVEMMLELMDFEIIYTDTLSFDQQIELFNSAKIIAGPSGASFSNMIFMQENTQAIIFSPSIIQTNYYIFQQIADIANVDLIHFLTIPKKNFNSVHDDFYIDCNHLKKLILNKLGNNNVNHYQLETS